MKSDQSFLDQSFDIMCEMLVRKRLKPGQPTITITRAEFEQAIFSVNQDIRDIIDSRKQANIHTQARFIADEARLATLETAVHDLGVKMEAFRPSQIQVVLPAAATPPAPLIPQHIFSDDGSLRSRFASLDGELLGLRRMMHDVEQRSDEFKRKLSTSEDSISRHATLLQNIDPPHILAIATEALQRLALPAPSQFLVGRAIDQLPVIQRVAIPVFEPLPDITDAVNQVTTRFTSIPLQSMFQAPLPLVAPHVSEFASDIDDSDFI
jgi:hypothetical protein